VTVNDILNVLRSLVDAVFRVGGISDAQHAELHGVLNANDTSVAAAKAAAAEAKEAAERQQLADLQAKYTQPEAPVQEPAFGTEETPGA
jgi:hypothetical protein